MVPILKNVFVTYKWVNKLECLSPAGLSSLVLYLKERPGASPRGEHLKLHCSWLLD